jgi:hypothetical protein
MFGNNMKSLAERDWHSLRAAHGARVDPWVAPRLARMSRQERHPVEDFLFEYYPHRPAHLRRWHPGFGTALSGPSAGEYLAFKFYTETPLGITAAPLPEARRPFVEWLRGMLSATASRTPFFGCHGLHEWAMVYRTGEIRHSRHPLRLSPSEIAGVVESLPVRCSHYDAFRFFTEAARPLNRLNPARETTAEFEQPGCLHANMDLYKWCFKLTPWCPSELTADAFELARDIRGVDMRASPYDFSPLGYAPIAIETPAGRSEYEKHQRTFAERAEPIREKLLRLCGMLLSAPPSRPPQAHRQAASHSPV